MPQSLPRTAYDIGKKFGNKKLTVMIDSDFDETMNPLGGTTTAYSVFNNKSGGHLYVFLAIPKNASDKDKEIRIAHEFGEIKFRENHPKISKTLHISGLVPFIGEVPKLINELLADTEARKRGFKIPYLYHLS